MITFQIVLSSNQMAMLAALAIQTLDFQMVETREIGTGKKGKRRECKCHGPTCAGRTNDKWFITTMRALGREGLVSHDHSRGWDFGGEGHVYEITEKGRLVLRVFEIDVQDARQLMRPAIKAIDAAPEAA